MSEAEPEVELHAEEDGVDMTGQQQPSDGIATDDNNNEVESDCPPAKRQKQSRVPCPALECDDTFTRPSALKRHWIRKHLEYENAYVCRFEKCKYKTDRRENMERHIEKIHQKAVRDRTRLSIEMLKIRMCAIPNDKYEDPIIDPPPSIQPLPGPCEQMLPSKPPVDPYWRKHGYTTPMHHPDYVPPHEDPFKVPPVPEKSTPKLPSLVVSVDNIPVSDNVLSNQMAADSDAPLINDVSMHTMAPVPVDSISFADTSDADYQEQEDAVAKVLHDLQNDLSKEDAILEYPTFSNMCPDDTLTPTNSDIRLFDCSNTSAAQIEEKAEQPVIQEKNTCEEVPEPNAPTLAFVRDYNIPRNACYLDGETKESLPTDRESLMRFYRFADHWSKYWSDKAAECKTKLKEIEVREVKALKEEVSQLKSKNLELEERLGAVRGVLQRSDVPL